MSSFSSKSPHIKYTRTNNLSSSPIPDLRSERKSFKLSLLKLNENFASSESRPSHSMNLLPQISAVKKTSFNAEKSKKSIKKINLDSQNANFYYFSPTKELNMSFRDAKSLFEEANKKNIDHKRYEEIVKKRDVLRQKREHIYKFEPNIKPKLYQSILHLSLLLKTFNEDFLIKALENNEEIKLLALEKISDIESSFYRIYEDFTIEINLFQDNLSKCEKERLIFEQKLEKSQSQIQEIDKKLKKTPVAKSTSDDKKMGFLLFENTKLESEVHQLNEKLKIFENYDVGPIMKELEVLKLESEEKTKKIQYELSIFKGKDDNHQNLINYYKNSIAKLEKEVKHWIQTSGENQKNVDKLTEKCDNLRIISNRNREILMMEAEEIQVLYVKKHEYSMILHEMQDKIKLLSIKIDKLTVQKGDNINEADYKNDLSILSTFSEFFSENLFKKLTKNNPISLQLLSNISMRSPIISTTRSYESNTNHPTYLKRFNFLKAPFYKLIEHRVKTANYSLKPNKKPHFHELLSKIRGIFDSKYNEFLWFSDAKLFSSFPDFVYSWLGKFEIDYDRKKIRKMDIYTYNTNVDDLRVQFLLDLTNPKVEKIWECAAFCEFLEEKMALDELFFYLHCRNLLFQGPQLQSLSAFFDMIHYIPFERAENLIDLIMHKYDIMIKSTIKSKLADKSKRKGPKNYIDSAFVLRVLLEYYRLERVDKFYLLEELFNSKLHKEDDKETVSFENFKKILQFNWPQLTDLEISEHFRESWGVGQGCVNAEAFFTVANENKFLIKTMKIPSIMSFEENLNKSNPYEKIRTSFFDNYALIKDNIEGIEDIFAGFGLEMLDEKFKKMIKTIQAEFQMPSEELKEKFISQFALELGYLLSSIVKIANSGGILQDPLKETKFLAMKENFNGIKEAVKEIERKEALKTITEGIYAKKIQKAIKQKKLKTQRSTVGQVVKNLKKNT